MSQHNILDELKEKSIFAFTKLERDLIAEGDYNHIKWVKGEPIFRYLNYRALREKTKNSAARFFRDLGFHPLGHDEAAYLYKIAFEKELRYWVDDPGIDNPFTRTPFEAKLDPHLRRLLKLKGVRNTNSDGIQQFPCFPHQSRKIMIGNYVLDIILFGVRPPPDTLSEDGKRRVKFIAIVIEVNGFIHDEPAKQRKDRFLRLALESHGIYVLEVTNEDVERGSNSALIKSLKQMISCYAGGTNVRATKRLKREIYLRTAATHLSLKEMDWALTDKFGKKYNLEAGFYEATGCDATPSMRRKIIAAQKTADALPRTRRPSSMGRGLKGQYGKVKYIYRNGELL